MIHEKDAASGSVLEEVGSKCRQPNNPSTWARPPHRARKFSYYENDDSEFKFRYIHNPLLFLFTEIVLVFRVWWKWITRRWHTVLIYEDSLRLSASADDPTKTSSFLFATMIHPSYLLHRVSPSHIPREQIVGFSAGTRYIISTATPLPPLVTASGCVLPLSRLGFRRSVLLARYISTLPPSYII